MAKSKPAPLADAEPLTEPKPLKYSFWAGALILKGSVTPRVYFDVITFGLIAVVVVVLATFAEEKLGIHVAVPVGPFEAAGAVLGLLLVMRTSAGNQRWWDARILWGGIVNQSRNLAIAAINYGPDDAQWRKKIVLWTAAFPHVTRRSLRNQPNAPEIVRLLGSADAQRIEKTEHMPGMVSRELARLLQKGRENGMNEMAFYEAERQRASLVDHLGGCERIRNTPLARSSAIQVRRFIFMFLSTLPFAWLDDFNYPMTSGTFLGQEISARLVMIPLFVMLMAYPLLSLDRIGMELQNPFDTRRLDHLPLDALCKTIEKNLLEMLQLDPIVGNEAPQLDSAEFPADMLDRLKGNPRDTFIS